MQSGLPVLASINPGNDLAGIIQGENVGRVVTDGSSGSMVNMVEELTVLMDQDSELPVRCRGLYERLFSPEMAVGQIVGGLEAKV